MTTVHFFAEARCQGDSSEAVTQDLSDLSSIGFLKRVKSMRVSGDPCVVFTEKGFTGQFALFREGDHDAVGGFSRNISSVRVVKGGLGDPEITIYEKAKRTGKSITLKSAIPNLADYGMNNMISCHQVKKGAWRIFQEEDYEGARIVALADDYVEDYRSIGFNDTATSLKPYKK